MKKPSEQKLKLYESGRIRGIKLNAIQDPLLDVNQHIYNDLLIYVNLVIGLNLTINHLLITPTQ